MVPGCGLTLRHPCHTPDCVGPWREGALDGRSYSTVGERRGTPEPCWRASSEVGLRWGDVLHVICIPTHSPFPRAL